MPERAVQAAAGVVAPTYPSLSSAVPASSPDQILASQQDLIDELQRTSALSHADFEVLILPVLRNYAAFVHLLPGSENHHHCGQGGLFRHGLEVAFYAGRKCEAAVFALDHTPSERKKLEPRWRIAAMVGGLMHDLGKPLIDIGAVDHSGECIWNPYTQSLSEWLESSQLDHYYFQWRAGARHKRHEAFTSVALGRIVPQRTMEWLAAFGGHEAIDAMMLALGGSTDPRNPLASIIKAADSASVSRDIADSRSRLAAGGMGGVRSLAARIVRAIYDQITSGEWKLNTPGDVVWVTNEGIFALYPEMARQVIEVLRNKGDNSLPTDAAVVLEVLSDHGYLVPNIQPNGQTFHTWKVKLKTEYRNEPVEVPIHAVRFMRDDVFPSDMVPPKAASVTFLDANGRPIGGPPSKARSASAERIVEAEQESPPSSGLVDPSAAAASSASTAPPTSERSKPTKPRRREDREPSTHQSELLAPDPVEADRDPLLAEDFTAPEASPEDEQHPATTAAETDESMGDRARAANMSIRDVEMLDARSAQNIQWPPESATKAEEWFAGQRPEGEFLIAIARRVRDQTLVAGQDVVSLNACTHIRYPGGFEELGMPPIDLLKLIESKGWAVRDMATPSRATVSVTLQGTRKPMSAVRLTPHVSAAFEMLLPASADTSERAPQSLPWGPYIDARTASHLTDKTKAIPEESPWVRIAFARYIAERDGVLITAEAPAPAEWATLMQRFCKQHRVKVAFWIFDHLTRTDNPLLRMHPEDTGSVWTKARFHPNPDYRADLDIAATGLSPTGEAA